MKFCDVGINLTDQQFNKDADTVLNNAFKQGVERLVITGTSEAQSRSALEMAAGDPRLYSTAGVHPHYADLATPDLESHLIDLYENNDSVVAIGECGLDFNRNHSTQVNQIEVFSRQLKLACELKAPIFTHQRDAHQAYIKTLKPYLSDINKLVVHCFTGTQAELEDYIERDFYIGITGWICDERRGKSVLDLIPLIPDNRLLIETDSPYLIPRNLPVKPKSNRNLPEYLKHIAHVISDKKEVEIETLAEQVWQNSHRFFNLR